MSIRRLSRSEARRIAIRAQLLDAVRPTDLLQVAEHLTFLQLDPTAVVAPNADLVAWSRIGNEYDPEQLRRALTTDRTMFEHRAQDMSLQPVIAMLRPMSHLPLHLAEMEDLRTKEGSAQRWLEANAAFRDRVLAQLRSEGPLSSRDVPDTADTAWESTGWTNDRNVTQMLEFLASRGYVAVSGRDGKQRLWDVAERVYPAGVTAMPLVESKRIRDENRLRMLGIALPKMVGAAGVPVEVDGSSRIWRIDADAEADDFEGRTALLSPFDRLIHDRARSEELFDFEFGIELYKPKAKRRWGYFAMPILHDDRLVGKVDLSADHEASVLNVHAMHHDLKFTASISAAVTSELEALAAWLGVDTVRFD